MVHAAHDVAGEPNVPAAQPMQADPERTVVVSGALQTSGTQSAAEIGDIIVGSVPDAHKNGGVMQADADDEPSKGLYEPVGQRIETVPVGQ